MAQDDNNFHFLRLTAASAVIFAHAYDLQGIKGFQDPFTSVTGFGLGWSGVNVFFVISGYLLTRSLAKNDDPRRYLRNRALRLMPGLLLCAAVTVGTLGIFATTLPAADFFSSYETWKYLVGVITLINPSGYLPGVFTDNPLTSKPNASLWSLPYEVTCYFALLIAWKAGLFRGPHVRLIFIGGLLAAIAFSILVWIEPRAALTPLVRIHRLGLCFGIGAAAAYFGVRVSFTYLLASIAIAVGLGWTMFAQLGAILALAACTLWLGEAEIPALRYARKIPDYSYGLYIYAFPIQQMLVIAAPQVPAAMQALLAVALTLIPASVSWHFVEEPWLKKKRSSELQTGAEESQISNRQPQQPTFEAGSRAE